MAILGREAILAARDLKTEVVRVPEWGGEVILSTMTAAARDAWEQSLIGNGKGNLDMSNISARLFVLSAVDDKGNRLFSDKEAEAMGRRSAKALKRCVAVIQKLNGITDNELEEVKGN